ISKLSVFDQTEGELLYNVWIEYAVMQDPHNDDESYMINVQTIVKHLSSFQFPIPILNE
ncbi:17005_t:CDS:2, partial [Dentiscutata heterogama]